MEDYIILNKSFCLQEVDFRTFVKFQKAKVILFDIEFDNSENLSYQIVPKIDIGIIESLKKTNKEIPNELILSYESIILGTKEWEDSDMIFYRFNIDLLVYLSKNELFIYKNGKYFVGKTIFSNSTEKLSFNKKVIQIIKIKDKIESFKCEISNLEYQILKINESPAHISF